MLDKIVTGVQIGVLALVVVAVIMLFANSPTPPPAAAEDAPIPAGIDAAAAYGSSCAGCHGGDGSGGIGPPVRSARMLERFPDINDQITVIASGRGGMPAFGSRLSAGEIEAITAYTRTSL